MHQTSSVAGGGANLTSAAARCNPARRPPPPRSAIRRRDVEGGLRELHPEVEGKAFIMSLEDEVFHGHEGFRRFLERVFEVFPDWDPEITEVLAHDDMVLVAVRVSGHGAASGAFPSPGRSGR